ncbi:MAG: DUF87 domain-containing protein [Candidatus Diapherotrites archaeon]
MQIDLLKYSYIKIDFDKAIIDSAHNKVLIAVGYPRQIRDGWLDKLISYGENFDISMHIEPYTTENALNMLNQEIVKQESDILSSEIKGIINPSLKIQHQDTLSILTKLQKGEEKLFNISFYVNARGENQKELTEITEKLKSALNSMMIIPKTPYFKMEDGIKSIMPLGKDFLKQKRNITTSALSAFFPFTTSFLPDNNNGIIFGFRANSFVPVIFDPFSLNNFNGVILGSSGSGKSMACKSFILKNLFNGVKVVVIDPQGEYSKLASALGGKIIDEKTGIGIFPSPGLNPEERIEVGLEFFEIATKNLLTLQKNFLTKAIKATFLKHGIRKDKVESWWYQGPNALEIIQELKKISKDQEMKDMVESLEELFSRTNYFFGNNSLNTKEKLIVFDISKLPEKAKAPAMFLLLSYVAKKIDKTEKTLLVVDEAWSLLRMLGNESKVFSIAKTARKFGLGIILITQETFDLTSSDTGKTILANSSWKFIARHEPSTITNLSETFCLNEKEEQVLMTSPPGEGILIIENSHHHVRVVCSPQEYKLMTTKIEEQN